MTLNDKVAADGGGVFNVGFVTLVGTKTQDQVAATAGGDGTFNRGLEKLAEDAA